MLKHRLRDVVYNTINIETKIDEFSKSIYSFPYIVIFDVNLVNVITVNNELKVLKSKKIILNEIIRINLIKIFNHLLVLTDSNPYHQDIRLFHIDLKNNTICLDTYLKYKYIKSIETPFIFIIYETGYFKLYNLELNTSDLIIHTELVNYGHISTNSYISYFDKISFI